MMVRRIEVPAWPGANTTYRLTPRVRLGQRLHPESVTAAWYAATCPPDFNPRGHVSRRDHLMWRFACWLRHAH